MNFTLHLKEKLCYTFLIFLSLWLLPSYAIAFQQPKGQAGSPNMVMAQNQNLTKVIDTFSKKYKVYFSYDAQQLKQLNTSFTFKSEEVLDAALDRLFKPLNIKYETIGDQFYVLELENPSSPSRSNTNEKSTQNSIGFQLLDQKDQSYIFNAFVFVRNSSLGTTSNLEGQVELMLDIYEEVEIVITHLNYETQSFILNDQQKLPTTIYLQPKRIGIKEVLVQAKKGKSKNRKAWMKRFQKAFFGKYQKRNRIKLLNPEVLWFEENNKMLTAHAVDHLSLVNEKLGYQMKFYLDTFNVNKTEDVIFAGKMFFEDIKSQISNTRKCEQRRKKTFENSPSLFFKNLHKGIINEAKYEVGVSFLASDGDSLQYEKIDAGDIQLARSQTNDTLFVNGHLTLIHKENLRLDNKQKFSIKDLNVSFFRPKKGYFLFNKIGQLTNQNEIVESGYWTNYRVASLMPIDYQKAQIDETQQSSSLLAIDQLEQIKERAGEKIYLQLNKPYYSNRESIWFKSYLVDAVSHSLSTLSKVIHIDLINPADSVLHTWTLHNTSNMYGDFQLHSGYPPGLYRLRAYTEYMRNFDEAYFFEKLIPVYDNYTNTLNINATSVNGNTRSSTAPISINFYPEGGDLISGLSSKVAFQTMDDIGNPLEVEGRIEDQEGNLVCRIKSIHQGVGLFNFTPQKEKKYKAIIESLSTAYEFDLPQHLPKGLTLNVNNSYQKQVYVQVGSTDELAIEKAFIVGHVRGEIFCHLNSLDTKSIIKINRDIIPEGLAHFTLFSGDGRPQAERLIFNAAKVSSDSEPIVVKNQEEKLSLELSEELKEQSLNLSISITNPNSIQYPTHGPNIRNYLLLNSDLKSPIPNPEFYFQEEGKKEKKYLLDLMLMTHGWRRFVWKEVLQNEETPLPYIAETGYDISGYTTRKDSDKRIQTEIMLNSFEENMIFKKVVTDTEGNFNFDNLLATDSTTYFLQARINKSNEINVEGKVKGNRLVDFHLYEKTAPPIRPVKLVPQIFEKKVPLNSHLKEEYIGAEEQDIAFREATWLIELDEISVSAKKGYQNNRPLPPGAKGLDLDYVDWIPNELMGPSLFAKVNSLANISTGPNGNLVSYSTNFQGQPTANPVTVIIDGMVLPGQAALAIPADAIRAIVVSSGAVIITTRYIPRSREKYLESGILPIEHPGYSKARTFYQTPSKAYPSFEKHQTSSAIYWNPNLQFNKNGKAWLPISSQNKNGNYEIVIEGVSQDGEIIYKRILFPSEDH